MDSSAVDLAASLVPLELADELAVAGSPNKVRERLLGLFGMGIDGVGVWLHPPRNAGYDDALDRLTEVVTQVRRALPAEERGLAGA